MADRTDPKTHSNAGWVWVIVGIVAVGLIIWWIAAAVDNGSDTGYQNEPVSSVEQQADETGNQIENTADQKIGDQDDKGQSGQMAQNQQGQPGQAESGSSPQQKPLSQAQMAQNSVDQNFSTLSRAAGNVVALWGDRQGPTSGQPAGGGPGADSASKVESSRKQLDKATQELEQAQQSQRPQAFQQASKALVDVIEGIQQDAQLSGLDQPVAQLKDSAGQISADQPLAEQQQQVDQFFRQSSQVISQMSQKLEGSQTGGGPADESTSPAK